MADATGARQNVTFPSRRDAAGDAAGDATGDEAHGYLAVPETGQGPGVIVIQEWWGLTSHIAEVADRLAAAGFVALAPDLYGGPTTHDADEAAQMMQDLPVERAVRDLAGAIDFLLSRPEVRGERVGLVGFCMGGAFVLTMAVQEGAKVAAAIPFYPVGPLPQDYSGLQAAVLAHFGDQDEFQPAGAADDLAARIESATAQVPDIRRYPAGHAFHNDDNLLGTYDPDLAGQAWDATVVFLRAQLV